MDPINPVAGNPEALNQIPTSKPPKSQKPLVLIMSVLLIVTVAIAGLFYFQIQKLSKQLSKYQTQPSPTPSATPDITVNWKTYSDPKGKYSFKYPSDWTKSNDVGLFNDPTKSFILGVEINPTSLDVNKWMTSKCLISGTNFCSDPIQGSITGSIQYNHPKSHYDSIDTLVTQENQIFDITLASRNPNQSADQNTKQIYDQILSTFKFLGSTSQPTPNIGQKISYQLPSGWQKVTDKTNTFEAGFNPETQTGDSNTTLAYENAVALTYKNADNNPYYSPFASSIFLWLLPYDNGSRHTFIETQVLKEKLSLHFKVGKSIEKEYVVQGKNCLVLYKLEDLSQGHTTIGVCPISNSIALVFSSFFDESRVKPMLQTLKLLK